MITRKHKAVSPDDLQIKRHFEDRIAIVPLTTACFLVNAKLPNSTSWILADSFEKSNNTGILLLEMVPHRISPKAPSNLELDDTGGSVQLAVEMSNNLGEHIYQLGGGLGEEPFPRFLTADSHVFKPNSTDATDFKKLSKDSFHLINHFGHGVNGQSELMGTIYVSRRHKTELVLTGQIIIRSETPEFQEIQCQESSISVLELQSHIQSRKARRQKEERELEEALRKVAKETAASIPPLPKLSDVSLEPETLDLLLVVPEDDIVVNDGTIITKEDSWGWLFDKLYLQRHGFRPKVCAGTSNILKLVTDAVPDLLIWFATLEMQDTALDFLSQLQQSKHAEKKPLTFILLTHRGPYPSFWELANAAEFFVMDPERFIGIILDLLAHKGIRAHKTIPPLPVFGANMQNHPDPEISEFFRKLPP